MGDLLLFAILLPVVGYLTSNKESFNYGTRLGIGIIAIFLFLMYIIFRLFV